VKYETNRLARLTRRKLSTCRAIAAVCRKLDTGLPRILNPLQLCRRLSGHRYCGDRLYSHLCHCKLRICVTLVWVSLERVLGQEAYITDQAHETIASRTITVPRKGWIDFKLGHYRKNLQSLSRENVYPTGRGLR
jgi:hypothetical protein